MRYLLLSAISLFLLITNTTAQISHRTDSIFNSLKLKFSTEALDNAKQEYELANDTIRAIMLKVYSMPMSSRAELIENYEQRKEEIHNLKNEFEKVVPKGYIVSLEMKLSDTPLRTLESVDLEIYKKDRTGKLNLIDAEWGLQYGSEKLDSLLQIIDWDMMTFTGIKNLFQVANCISIQNGEQTEIGFARSGLGKYSYLFFPEKLLTVSKIKKYNDGCQYIYYKENIVLKYDGGMAGPQCFTD